MKTKIGITLLAFLFLSAYSIQAQNEQEKEPTWEELAAQYECPEWFRDAKFGIWCHWGPQVVPETGGGWYGRHMYMSDVGSELFGSDAYPYHIKTYGHPSEFGFKDVINQWKAERFDAESLMDFFKDCGAKYFYATANHHDHFDLFASTHLAWNSVNMGPKRDIVGEFGKAAKKRGLRFGITSHDNRHWWWFSPAFSSDKYGPKKGVPYDGYLTKADGTGKWWEGYDPAELYGPPPSERTPELEEEMKKNWMDRHLELVNKYEPDLFYYDSYDFSYGKYGREVTRTLHANSLKKHGKIQTVMSIKSKIPGIVWDIEKGGSTRLEELPWQSESTFGNWFYKPDAHRKHSPETIITTLANAVSKNGNLLLNVELKPDGTIPPVQKMVVSYVGDWLKVNGEAIYGTRPWVRYGDGASFRGKGTKAGGKGEIEDGLETGQHKAHYNERTLLNATPYAHDEVRFTTKEKYLYAIVLNPMAGKLEIRSLGKKAVKSTISKIEMLASDKGIQFKQNDDVLTVEIPQAAMDDSYAIGKLPIVLKIQNAITDK